MKLVITFLLVLFVTALNVNGQTSKYQKTIEDVFNRLNTAIGDGKYPPKLKIEFTREFVAQFVAGRNEIQIEEAAYEVCRSMGKDSLDALAFILGHELTHYYKRHNWLGEQGSGFASKALSNELEKVKVALDTTVLYETEADKFGFYFAKKAGFSIKKGSEVLTKLYAEYNLPDSISPRYPTLSDRIKISTETAEEAKELNEVFNVANILFLIDQPRAAEAASMLFEQILMSEMGTKEVYNNMGLCYLKMGLEKSDDEIRTLIGPLLHVDPQTSLDEHERSLTYDSIIAAKAINKALEHFETALRIDSKYLQAQVNKAITMVLLKNKKYAILQIFSDVEESAKDNKVLLDQMEYLKAFNTWYINQSLMPEFISNLANNQNTFALQFLSIEKNRKKTIDNLFFQSKALCLDSLNPEFKNKKGFRSLKCNNRMQRRVDDKLTYIKYSCKKSFNIGGFNAECKAAKFEIGHPAYDELVSFIITNKIYETPTANDSILLSKANGSFYLMVRKFNDGKFGEVYVLSSDF